VDNDINIVTMFSTIRGFLNRHRRKFIVGGILVGGAVLLSRYTQKKLREWQERETKEFLERTRRQHHFESTERTCNQTILSLTPTIREAIVKILDTEKLVIMLRSDPPDKVSLWEELKILAFTRASVLVYAGAMLVVALRIQLNLIGGYMYQDSTSEAEGGTGTAHINSTIQHRYLSLCHYFVNEGIRELCTLIEVKVRLIVEGTSLKQKFNLQDTEQLFWAIQAAVTGDLRDPIKCLAQYVLPPDRPTTPHCDTLQKMISETIDLLESDEIISLTSSSVSRGFSLMVDQISDYYRPAGDKTALNLNAGPSGLQSKTQIPNSDVGYSNGFTTFTHPNSVAMPMAKLIPIVNGLIQNQAGHGGGPDPWIQQLILDDKLKLLGANVYEAFSNRCHTG
jgi:peroxin-3